jgi:hypothetical protein
VDIAREWRIGASLSSELQPATSEQQPAEASLGPAKGY